MKGALVTGAAQRIGRSIALRLAADGWHVIVHHRDSNDAAASAVQEIAEAGGVATALHADLSDSAACVALIEDASAATKGLTCLINNASMFVEDRIDNVSASLFDQVMAVNLRAPALLSRHFAAQLPEEANGVIVNILDQKLANTNPDFLSYSLSKYGLAGMTDMLAMALGPRVRVCGVAPGLTLQSGDQTQSQFDAVHARTPLARGSSPEDVAGAVQYLVGAEAITGETILVDGGQHLVRSERDVMFLDHFANQDEPS